MVFMQILYSSSCILVDVPNRRAMRVLVPSFHSHFASSPRVSTKPSQRLGNHWRVNRRRIRSTTITMTRSLDNVVLIDMDNTIVDWDLEFGKRWIARRPDDTLDLIKQRKHFELEQNFPADTKPMAIEIMSEPGFYAALEPQPGAVEAIKEMTDAGLHVLLCTSPTPFQYETCVAEKYAWVREYLGSEFLERIIITRDKSVIRGKVLIDDKPHVKGQCDTPDWTQILFEQPYNLEVNDKPRMCKWSDWRKVLGAYFEV